MINQTIKNAITENNAEMIQIRRKRQRRERYTMGASSREV